MRIAMGIEYDGRRYNGWQRQGHALAVQECVETAVARIADQPLAVTCAGRTDAGVHATGQVIHFDTEVRRPLHGWLLGTNTHLPPDIAVTWVREVPDAFHARHTATARMYRYVVLNRPVRAGLLHGRVAWVHAPLDAAAMQAAATDLLGEHDFSAFRSSECQARHAVRELRRLDIAARGGFLALDVEANAFLHHMVRNLAGVLFEIGSGRQPPGWARAVLEGRDRRAAGVTAPAAGLYLARVRYPDALGIPATEPPAFW